jgi:hypothetical protein
MEIQGQQSAESNRYWDATSCVDFGLRMAREALGVELRKEIDFILPFDAVHRVINGRYELRGSTLATLLSIALNSDGTISKTKRKRYSEEVPEEVFAAIERAHGVLHPAAGPGTACDFVRVALADGPPPLTGPGRTLDLVPPPRVAPE